MSRLCAIAGVLTLLVALPGAVAQQTTASIRGTVSDASGAVVPGASISATSGGTGLVTRTTSDATGEYEFVTLPPDTYTIAAEKTGFTTTSLSGIALQVYQKATVNISLAVGSATQTVTVQAESPLVDSTTASLGTVVGEQSIQTLPLNLRQIGALALVVPGTVDTTGRSLTSAGGNGSGFNDNSYAGAGGVSGGNLLLIDGMLSRSLNNGSFALNPPPDFIREFKIQNNVYDAAFGMTSGTAMNVVTMSGTNSLHGSVWEFLRNRDLDARGYAATPQLVPIKPQYIRNQFGGSIGGPILKNKLFLFGAFEGLRLSRLGQGANFVPTATQKQGDFSGLLTGSQYNLCGAGGSPNLNYDTGQLFDPKSEYVYTCPNGSQVLAGTPIPGNNVAAYVGGVANFDPFAQKMLAFMHDPAQGSSFYINPASSTDHRNQYVGRLDWSATARDLVMVRYLLGASDQYYPGAFNTFNSLQHFRGHNVVGGWTRTFSPTLINDVRIGYQGDYLKYSCAGCPRAPGTLASFGITNLAASVPEFEEYPNVGFSNFPALGDGFPGFYPDVLPDEVYKYEDTLTKVLKRHTLTFGADMNAWTLDGVSDPIFANGFIQFSGQYSSLNGASSAASSAADLVDFELGSPSRGQYTKGAFISRLIGGRWYNIFAGDTFRVSSKVTLEFGLRWEYRLQPYDKNGQAATFYPLSKSFRSGDALLIGAYDNATNDALCSQTYFQSAGGQCLVATSDQRQQLGFTGNNRKRLSFGPGNGNFVPRLGFSVQPLQSDRLVLHGGVGAFLDLPISNPIGSYVNNNPISTQTPLYYPQPGSPPPAVGGSAITTEQIFTVATPQSLSQISSQLLPSPYYHTPTVWEWSLSVQDQILQNTALEVAYLGNRGYHLDFNHVTGNQPLPNTGNAQSARPWPDFNFITYDSYDGYSNYNALTAKVTQRLNHGLSGLISYSYGKILNIGDGSTDGGAINSLYAAQDDNNPHAEYGVSNTSLRHRLVLSGIYELPFGRNRAFGANAGAAVNTLIGDWEVSPIIALQSGFPFAVNLPFDQFTNTGSPAPRPDRVCSGKGRRSKNEWFNANCFTTDALQAALQNGAPRFGDSGRNILSGPRLTNIDLSVIKKFHIWESFGGEFYGQFFNLLNHPNFALPNAQVGTGTYNTITSTVGNSRDIQFGLKLKF